MIFIPLAILVFVLIVIYARPETRGCRWRMDRTRDREGESYFRCVACGAEVFTPDGKPPKDCLRG